MNVPPSQSSYRRSIPAGFALLVCAATAPAQVPGPVFQVSAADTAAARAAVRSGLHPLGANTAAASRLPRTAMPSAGPANPSGPFQNGRARYPGDISYQGGSVVAGAQSHAV